MTEPAIISLEISNPFFEGRNRVYLLPSDPVTLIDTGIATERGFGRLVEGLGKHGFSIGDIQRVILSHKHIDHIGNAWRIQQQAGADILIHESEVAAVTDADPTSQRFRQLVEQRLEEWRAPTHGAPGEDEQFTRAWEIQSATAHGLVDGQRLPIGDSELEILHTPGHTFGSICIRYGRQLFTGDHVLPDISPNIGGGDMRRKGLLAKFMDSLERIADIDAEVDRAFPGHGEPFENLAERCGELRSHHQERLDRLLDILRTDGPQHVYGAATRLFGELEKFHIVLGCAETQAHLEVLIDDGQVEHYDQMYKAV